MCAGALGGQNSLEPELRRLQAAQHGYWEANSGSLHEQSVLLTYS